MTFPHVLTEPKLPPRPPRQLRKFAYRVYDGGTEQEIQAHEIYFYDHGRIGFWNDSDDGERVLILGTKAFQVREVVGS